MKLWNQEICFVLRLFVLKCHLRRKCTINIHHNSLTTLLSELDRGCVTLETCQRRIVSVLACLRHSVYGQICWQTSQHEKGSGNSLLHCPSERLLAPLYTTMRVWTRILSTRDSFDLRDFPHSAFSFPKQVERTLVQEKKKELRMFHTNMQTRLPVRWVRASSDWNWCMVYFHM